jgi:hypothetical protein
LSDVGLDESTNQREEEDEESRVLWEKEQLARDMNLSIILGEGRRPRSHVHGVEPSRGSKFWANGDDEESSNDEDMEEVVAAGFTIDQLCQTEEELSSPASESPEVSAKLQEGSVSKKIVQPWSANRQSKAKPWVMPQRLPI